MNDIKALAVIMLSDETYNGAPAKSPQSLGDAVTTITGTYWEDVDEAWQQALAAGAYLVYPLADQFYGDRVGRLRDPFGQQRMLSQHIEDVPTEENDTPSFCLLRPRYVTLSDPRPARSTTRSPAPHGCRMRTDRRGETARWVFQIRRSARRPRGSASSPSVTTGVLAQ